MERELWYFGVVLKANAKTVVCRTPVRRGSIPHSVRLSMLRGSWRMFETLVTKDSNNAYLENVRQGAV